MQGTYADFDRRYFQNGRPRRAVDDRGRPYQYRRVTGVRSTELRKYEDGSIAVRYHRTDVLTVTPDDKVTVDTGGWHSVTTASRLKEYMPGSWNFFRRGDELFWYGPGIVGVDMRVEQPLTDGDFITADGELHCQKPPNYYRQRKKRNVTPPPQ